MRGPPTLEAGSAGRDRPRTLAAWMALGVRRIDGTRFSRGDVAGSLLLPNAASGAVRAAAGQLRQGALEQSNVDMGREMADLTTAERNFQLTSNAIQTESQMMSIAKYNMERVNFSPDLIDTACETYFISDQQRNFGAQVRV